MKNGFLIDGSIAFEPVNYKLTINNKDVRLSQKECQVLEILCCHSNVVVERTKFIEPIWGNSASGDIGLNKSILLLRRKFESHNLTNLINTVPRVGYSLNASVSELSYSEDSEFINPILDDESLMPLKEEPKNLHHRKFSIIAASILILLFSGYFIWNSENSVRIEETMEAGNNKIYFTIDTSDSSILEKTNKQLNNDSEYDFRALLSSKMLSIIFFRNNSPVNQKAFLIDSKMDMHAQLACIDDYLSKNMNYVSDTQSDILKGMTHSMIQFYHSCKNKMTSELATLYTKASHLGHPMDSDHMVLQEFLLKSKGEDEVFHIKRYVNYIGVGSDKMRMIQKSVVSDNINIKQVHTNEFYSELLSEVTKNEVLHVRVEPQLYISEIFDGMLYYAKKYQ
ncbi:transcriptional regulator [Aeromonas caviae]|uniref:winged helix-turn-helix domain-containing protein n=1 Tax=Aeromonas caviae TaxID=648 RepID=UPI002B45A472|nr:winged helix-turn-helix domain-containing protein [Aeromonas caviae]